VADGTAAYRLFIGGEWIEPAGGHYDVVNPATEEVVGAAPQATVEQADDAAAAAADALRSWSRTTPEHRSGILARTAEILEGKADELTALAMGNTVVVKPAPQNPLSVLRMAEALEEAGLPPGVLNVVTGTGADVAEATVTSAHVDMISFTGSTAVGRRIGEIAGRDMKRLLLELGGKGAALVFDDADLASAVAGIGSTWSFYSGQICTAPTRVLAQRGVYDELVERLAAYARALPVGDPLEAGTVVGPVISAAHRDRVEGYLEVGRSEGAELVVGGARPDLARGFYVAPALFAGCGTRMRVVQEEIFGPVVVVQPFDDEDEGVDAANDSDFGLLDYVWSGDTARGYRVARQLRAGGVGINTVGRNMEAPFGGFKASGVGRDVGSFALHAYSELQSIVWPS